MAGETTTEQTTEQTGEAGTPADKLYSQEQPSDNSEDKTSDDAGEKTDDKSEDKTEDKSEDKTEDKSEDKSEDEKDKSEEDDKPSLEIKVPEGVEVDNAVLDEVRALAEKAGLNSEQVQPLVDLHFKQLEAQANELAAAGQKAWDDTISGWKDAISKDPDIGGDKSEAVQSVIGKALDQYGSAEARDAFDLTGAGWNPAIVKFVHNMAKALNEGTQVTPKDAAPKKPASYAEALYGQST